MTGSGQGRTGTGRLSVLLTRQAPGSPSELCRPEKLCPHFSVDERFLNVSFLLLMASVPRFTHAGDFHEALCGSSRLSNAAQLMICLFSESQG